MNNLFPLPCNLLLEINCRCNYNCPWCYCVWHENPTQPIHNIPMKSWEKIIACAIANGVKSFLFSGGELTLRKGWQNLLCYTRSLLTEGTITIFTNGSRVTEDDLLLCKKNRIAIGISLQGLRTYSAMTGTNRGYRKTLELLMRAKELHHPCSASVTVTQQNLFEIEDIYSAASISGASVVQFNAVMFAGKVQNRTDFALHPEDWHALKKRMEKLSAGNIPIVWEEEIICLCEHPNHKKAEWELAKFSPCSAGKQFGVIGPDGYFRKCLHTTEKLFYWKRLFEKELVQ